MLDCTASMRSWIVRSKETLADILKNIKKDYAGLKVRVAFVGYRDITDRDRFEIFNFSEDLDACTRFIAKMNATGGADFPEDVQGGFNKALNLPWTKGSTR
jgi:molybdenum cofactor biosynthesis enzyme MoaA